MRQRRSRKGAPGIVDVAQRAGVSPATVSRFFNTPDVVRAPTRKRIEEAAAALGYIRDRMAGALHDGFSGTIGLVVPTIDNAIFSQLIEAFQAKLGEHDRTMLIAAHGYDLSMEVGIVRSLLERRIDGVALIGLEHDGASLEMLALRHVPVLATWNYRADSPIPCIGADNVEAGRLVAQHLIERGHRRIALLFPPHGANDRARDRLAGAQSACREAGLDDDRIDHVETLYDIGQAKRRVRDYLSDVAMRPTAFVCGNDVIAQGAVYACQSLGLRVPQDMSIIGIGDFAASAHMEPALTTLRLPARQIGAAAAEALCSGQLLSSTDVLRRKLPLELKERGSVRQLN